MTGGGIAYLSGAIAAAVIFILVLAWANWRTGRRR